MPAITIYLLCYNEEVLLPHAIKHYRQRFPNAKFIIINNESTDRSVEIALEAGCEIYPWATGNISNIIKHTELKNNIWKTAETDWVIIADMDEWLELTEAQLDAEDKNGVTILRVKGIQIVGDSQSVLLDDVDLHSLKNGFYDANFDKSVCFKRSEITEMNFTRGAHKSSPLPPANRRHSKLLYHLKHMNYLGFLWYQQKMKARYARTDYNRSKLRCSGHYTNNDTQIKTNFNKVTASAKPVPPLFLI
jgi:glycosyltransferase involved in cell wall biosynthesis